MTHLLSGMKSKIHIGIDMGGTNVRVGAVALDGTLLAVHQAPIEPGKPPEIGVKKIESLINASINDVPEAELMGIGIGATGPVDRTTGRLQNPYTLPKWDDFPIVSTLADMFHVPVTLENDADAAALGEFWVGAGRNSHRLAAITIGTGVGGSIIIDGEIYRGLEGTHPEIGHHIIDPSGPMCYCGARGCWERLVSGPAIAEKARTNIKSLSRSQLFTLVDGDISKIDAHLVTEAARNGDDYALSIIHDVGKYIRIGLLNVISFFVPDTIVMSGGVMNSLDLILDTLQKDIHFHNKMVPSHRVKILPANLGYHAGVIGATYPLIKKSTEHIASM